MLIFQDIFWVHKNEAKTSKVNVKLSSKQAQERWQKVGFSFLPFNTKLMYIQVFLHVHPVKAQISLNIHAVWLQYSPCNLQIAKEAKESIPLPVDSKDFDQIRAFIGVHAI